MHKIGKTTVSFLLLLLITVAPVFADDVKDAVNRALSAYDAENYSNAMNELNFARGLIVQKIAGRYSDALPKAETGWTAEDIATEIPTAMAGGGIVVSRSYQMNDKNISIEIISDSPMISSLLMMFNNPMFAGASGSKITAVKGERAIEEWDSGDKEGQIQVVLDNRMLITVSGSMLDNKSEMKTYMEKVDFDLLKKLLRG